MASTNQTKHKHSMASTNQTKHTNLLNKQKNSSRRIYYEDKYTHARPLMQSLNALNIYFSNSNIYVFYSKT